MKLEAITTLLERARGHIRRRVGIPSPRVETTYLGRSLRVRAGSLPTKPDYDDAWLFACAKHAEVAMDVGANLGQSSILMLLGGSIREVVLVEANPEALAIAAENLIANQLCRHARFVSAFASDQRDEAVELWTVGTGAAGSMYKGHAVTAAAASSVQRVRTITIDDLCSEYRIVPDFVKIDVEGAESKVLTGATALAKHGRTRFLVEMHSPPELPMTANAELVLAWARGLDYAAWYLAAEQRLERPDDIARRGRCHLLLQPAAWEYPDWLRGIAQSAPLPSVS